MIRLDTYSEAIGPVMAGGPEITIARIPLRVDFSRLQDCNDRAIDLDGTLEILTSTRWGHPK
jgi:hypothetical protein